MVIMLTNSVLKKYFSYFKIGGLLIIPIVLLVLPANFFDDGPPICLFTLLSDIHCPGCGMTRGIMHLIHGQFATAFEFNKLSFIIFPIVSWLWLRAFLVETVYLNLWQPNNFMKKILK